MGITENLGSGEPDGDSLSSRVCSVRNWLTHSEDKSFEISLGSRFSSEWAYDLCRACCYGKQPFAGVKQMAPEPRPISYPVTQHSKEAKALICI